MGPMVYQNGEETVYKIQFFLIVQIIQGQSTHRTINNCCVKCFDSCKMSKQQVKCKHRRRRSRCKGFGRSQICEHNKIKSQSFFCGRSQICGHNKRRSLCLFSGGSQICEHNKRRSRCNDCDPHGHLAKVVRGHVYTVLKNDKDMSSREDLGCNIETFKKLIGQQLTEGMLWENYGEWHIDHKIPLKYNKPSLEEVAQQLHYTNTQPMWASENTSKGCRYLSGQP